MASAPAALLSRSIQHLLRRRAATTSALSIVSGKSVIGRINPEEEDPISATGVTNLRFSGQSVDMALFGRFDWPAITASEQVNLLAKESDDDFSDEDSDEFDDGDIDSDDFDEDDDVSDSFDGEDDDESENKTVRQAKLKE